MRSKYISSQLRTLRRFLLFKLVKKNFETLKSDKVESEETPNVLEE